MVRKIEQRRVRGALDRFGPPLESGGDVLTTAGDECFSPPPQLSLEVKRSYIKVRGGV